jgi:ABC-type cobalamin/Fe3+-siderophores transport system ATPase subunit
MAQARKLEKVVCLKNITVKIPKGQFVCIIGKVGSGKSSLLSAMTGELLPISQDMIDYFKGDKDMTKELDQDETVALRDELIRYYNKVGHQ